MSAAGRGAVREEFDTYYTPRWTVRRLIERVALPGGSWLEPCAGDGNIITSVERRDVQWTACDIRPECRKPLEQLGNHSLAGEEPHVETVHVGNVFELLGTGKINPRQFRVALTNPPFTRALELVEALLPHTIVVMLLRLNWLGGDPRADFLARHYPDVYVLPNRPPFKLNDSGKVATDATEYAWMLWPDGTRYRPRGKITTLAQTADTELAEHRDLLRSNSKSKPSAVSE